MGQSFKNAPNKICGRQPLKNFTWSILEYLVPYDVRPWKYVLGWTERRTEGQTEKSDMLRWIPQDSSNFWEKVKPNSKTVKSDYLWKNMKDMAYRELFGQGLAATRSFFEDRKANFQYLRRQVIKIKLSLYFSLI